MTYLLPQILGSSDGPELLDPGLRVQEIRGLGITSGLEETKTSPAFIASYVLRDSSTDLECLRRSWRREKRKM